MAGEEYFVGQVADILGGGKKKKKKSTVSSSPANKLASLFDVKHKVKYINTDVKSVHKKTKVSKAEVKQTKNSNKSKHAKGKKVAKKSKENINLTETMDIKEKKKKKKKKSVDSESSVSDGVMITTENSEHSKGFCPPEGVVHEFLVKGTTEKTEKTMKRKREEEDEAQSEEDDVSRQRPKRKKRDKTKDKRTVFVGNLPLDAKKAAVKKLFSKFGTIENMRYRCPPRSDTKISKKLTVIRKEFHNKRSNIVAFVCFEDLSSAQKALALNGYDMDGFHLRVDLSSNDKKNNKTKSVFVGNVHFEVEENALRDHFEPCGVIENVRIVRDKKTGLGKGFAFIEFSEKMSIDLALKLHDSKFKGKQLRVTKCEEVVKAQKKEYSHPAQQRMLKKAKKLGKKPTNMRPGEKRKPKSMKKRDKAKKPRHRDQLKKAFSTPATTNGSNKHIKFN